MLAEILGRRVFSKRRAKKAMNGNVPVDLFLPEEDKCRISVDSLHNHAVPSLNVIAEQDSLQRTSQFEGWAVVRTEIAASSGRKVQETPTCRNPFHADIVLPDEDCRDKGARKAHAYDLAKSASWQPALA